MKPVYFILLSLLFILHSCKEETTHSPVLAEKIHGTWQVIEATRNNRAAKSLAKAEFYINDSTFATNFLPDKSPYRYSFDGKKLNVMSPKETQYEIEFKNSDTLILETEIRNFDFMFVSIKKEDESSSQ